MVKSCRRPMLATSGSEILRDNSPFGLPNGNWADELGLRVI